MSEAKWSALDERPPGRKRRVAAVGDLHCKENSHGEIAPLFEGIDQHAELLLLCGDLTDLGTVAESEVLANELRSVRVPMFAVLGNHDFESGCEQDVQRILRQAGVVVLDGDGVRVDDELGIAGCKGFCGGFGDHLLQSWGEQATKAFVMAAIEEVLKLEKALGRLHTARRLVVTHYAPMRGTVLGEPPELHPFLGTSRLQDPINRFHATAVFHGHAHRGTHTDRTDRDVPVYNCALPLLRRLTPPRNYAVVEV